MDRFKIEYIGCIGPGWPGMWGRSDDFLGSLDDAISKAEKAFDNLGKANLLIVVIYRISSTRIFRFIPWQKEECVWMGSKDPSHTLRSVSTQQLPGIC